MKAITNGERDRGIILDIINRHPEGLTSQEIRRAGKFKYELSTVTMYITDLINSKKVAIAGNNHHTPVYIPIGEVAGLSPVSQYLMTGPRRKGNIRDDTIYLTHEILYIIEEHPEGMSSREIKRALGTRWDGRHSLHTYLRHYIGRILQADVLPEDEMHTYKVIGSDKYVNHTGERGRLPISYLYNIYERKDVKLEDGRIPQNVMEDITRLIRYSEKVRETTSKDIMFKIRFMDNDVRVATLIYTIGGDSGVMYQPGTIEVMTGDEMLEWINLIYLHGHNYNGCKKQPRK